MCVCVCALEVNIKCWLLRRRTMDSQPRGDAVLYVHRIASGVRRRAYVARVMSTFQLGLYVCVVSHFQIKVIGVGRTLRDQTVSTVAMLIEVLSKFCF